MEEPILQHLNLCINVHNLFNAIRKQAEDEVGPKLYMLKLCIKCKTTFFCFKLFNVYVRHTAVISLALCAKMRSKMIELH